MLSIYTIGHSNHPVESFLHLLQSYGIQVVVDVRSAPYSRHVPCYNKNELESVLGKHGVRYLFMGDCIGGKPGNPGFRGIDGKIDYAKIAAGKNFQQGIERILKGIRAGWTIALLCAEEDPAKCHRQWLIAKELVRNRDVTVRHIRANGRVTDAGNLCHGYPAQMKLFQ